MWHLGNPQKFRAFCEATEKTTCRPGQGLPGQVISATKPVWIADLAGEPTFQRAAPAAEVGIKSGLGIPVMVGDEVVGVLEFFSEDPNPPGRLLLEVLGHIGTQLGRVVERTQAAADLEHSASLLSASVEAIVDGFVIFDADNRLVLCNNKYREIYAPVGKTWKPGTEMSKVARYGNPLYGVDLSRGDRRICPLAPGVTGDPGRNVRAAFVRWSLVQNRSAPSF